MQKVKYITQRKAMLLSQRNIQSIVSSRRLQLEIERSAKPFTQGQAPSFIDPPAERRVNDQLHPAALIEESLRDNSVLRWHGSQHRAPGHDVLHDLFGPSIIQSALALQPFHSRFNHRRSLSCAPAFYPFNKGPPPLPQARHFLRQLRRPRRSLPQPERHA